MPFFLMLNWAAPLRDKDLVKTAGRARLYWFSVFLPVEPLPKLNPDQILKNNCLISTVDEYPCCSFWHVISVHSRELNLTESFRNIVLWVLTEQQCSFVIGGNTCQCLLLSIHVSSSLPQQCVCPFVIILLILVWLLHHFGINYNDV